MDTIGHWEIPEYIDIDSFDFDWLPDPYDPPYIHQFGTSQDKGNGPRFIVEDSTEVKYHAFPLAKHKNEMGIRVIPDSIYAGDFTWSPEIHEPLFIHQWPATTGKDHGPRLVIPGATEVKYHDLPVFKHKNESGVWKIDKSIYNEDFDWSPDIYEPLFIHQWPATTGKDHGPRLVIPGATEVKYHDLPVFKHKNESGVWKIPDSIHAGDFDFDWSPDIHEPLLIHQWPATTGKDHGPRLVIPGARRIKYHHSPVFKHKNESGVWDIPMGLTVNGFDFDWAPDIHEPLLIHQWPSVHGQDLGPRLVIPTATAVKYHQSPVFDYKPLDIIFVSNGETGEQRRYDRLRQVAGRTVEWVRGINGRENALRRAAELSTTEWFFCFPGKLYTDLQFDFNFQPDRSYEPKHYIFYAENPLNSLVYGHQAAVCYNRQHILETIDYGLDFTMSKPHDIVPIISGVAEYNSDAIMTWRTAFREAIKLSIDGSEESKERLNTWRSFARGPHAEWSLIGAEDGVRYAESVKNLPSELMKSFEWSWLNQLFENKYGKR